MGALGIFALVAVIVFPYLVYRVQFTGGFGPFTVSKGLWLLWVVLFLAVAWVFGIARDGIPLGLAVATIVVSALVVFDAVRPGATAWRVATGLAATSVVAILGAATAVGFIGPAPMGHGDIPDPTNPIYFDSLRVYINNLEREQVFDSTHLHMVDGSALLVRLDSVTRVPVAFGPRAHIVPDKNAHHTSHSDLMGTGPRQGRILARIELTDSAGVAGNWQTGHNKLGLALGFNYVWFDSLDEDSLTARALVIHVAVLGGPVTGVTVTRARHRTDIRQGADFASAAFFYDENCYWVRCNEHGCMIVCDSES